jgi:hypothetical protein
MVQFHQSPNSLLDSLEKIHQVTEETELRPEKLADCQSDIQELCSFFQCSEQQAVLLGLLLRRHYHNDEPSVEDLLEHTCLKVSAAIHVHRLLKDFVDKGWLKPKQDIRYFPLCNYKFSSRFLHCVTTRDWSHLESKPIKNSFDLIERFGKHLQERKADDICYSKLEDTTRTLIDKNETLPISVFILEKELGSFDTIAFLSMCYRHYRGSDSFDFDTILDEIRPPMNEQYRFRQQIKGKKSVFFQMQLVDRSSSAGMMFSGEEYRLSEMAIRSFNPDPVSTDKMIKSSLLQTIFYDKIPERKLFYEKNERLHVNRLHDLLEPIRFDAFLDRMAVLKMKRGLTVLLYGAPGTGKTESVYQLARLSRRHVLEADASTVRSKWVGDTEKNIRNLFQDYKNACETFDEVPILLFNEADSILGKRRPVIDRVEQMENTLQNLLLQELENFEGIFIATTNLEDNLDPAFDRRILYKVRFTHPSDSLRISIWNDKLPNISNELIESVNIDFKLTGGQIDNIRKKIEVDKLLNPEMNVEESYLRNLAEEELSLRKGETRSSIGFLINQNDSDT